MAVAALNAGNARIRYSQVLTGRHEGPSEARAGRSASKRRTDHVDRGEPPGTTATRPDGDPRLLRVSPPRWRRAWLSACRPRRRCLKRRDRGPVNHARARRHRRARRSTRISTCALSLRLAPAARKALRSRRRAGPVAASVICTDSHTRRPSPAPRDRLVGGCSAGSLPDALVAGTDEPVAEVVATRSVGDEPGRAITPAWCALTRGHGRPVPAERDRMGSGPRRAIRHGGHSHHSGSAPRRRVGSPSNSWRQRPHCRGGTSCGSGWASTTPITSTASSLRAHRHPTAESDYQQQNSGIGLLFQCG